MTIERTSPMWVHKSMIIRAMHVKPTKWRDVLPGSKYRNLAEATVALVNDAREWFIGGEFLTDAEAKTKYPV